MIASTLLHLPNLLPGSYTLKIYMGMILEEKEIYFRHMLEQHTMG